MAVEEKLQPGSIYRITCHDWIDGMILVGEFQQLVSMVVLGLTFRVIYL